MRLFVGTMLGEASQGICDRLVRHLLAGHREVLRGIPAGSAHLTYVFCAAAPEDRMAVLLGALSRTAAAHSPFAVRLGEARLVPSSSRPRLVCAEVGQGAEHLRSLTESVAADLRTDCPDLEWTPTRAPHVTLARFRKHARGSDARAVAQTLTAAGGLGITERVGTLQLVTSELTPRGPMYHVAGAATLGPR